MNKDHLKQILKKEIILERWKISGEKQLEITYNVNNKPDIFSYTFPAIKFFKKYGYRLCLFVEILSTANSLLRPIDEMGDTN